MTYTFKSGQELGWLVLVAAIAAALQILASTDPSTVTDWKTYATALGIAAARAALAAGWNFLSTKPLASGRLR